ncbi:MAG: hemolysin III family protein [Ndongobacter sp.]|nr:hemolysin III family protein [Ndongobacter sp.]
MTHHRKKPGSAGQKKEVRPLAVKDPGSALTHFIGFVLSLLLLPVLLLHAVRQHTSPIGIFSLGVFVLSMILLYAASTAYHTFDLSPAANLRLKKVDHIMIFVLIAGSYTPICLIALPHSVGIPLLIAIWSCALIGGVIKFFWVTCPKWFSSVLYITMGWLCIFALPQLLERLPGAAFAFLLAGGVIYTIGGIIYALKLVHWNKSRPFIGSHEVFHLFVLAGNLCHVLLAYFYLCGM